MSAKTCACVLVMLAVAGTAQAGAAASARIETVSGSVLTVGAKGSAAAKAGQALSRGDRIVARTGQARLRYSDGCVVTVKTGAMATIAAASPCAGGAGLVNTQPADAAAFMDAIRHPDGATIVAGVGSLVLGVAVLGVGVLHPQAA